MRDFLCRRFNLIFTAPDIQSLIAVFVFVKLSSSHLWRLNEDHVALEMCILVSHVGLMCVCLWQMRIEVEVLWMASLGNREFTKHPFILLLMSRVLIPRQCLRTPHYLFACVAWRADTSLLPFLPNFSPEWSKAVPVLLSWSLAGTSMPPPGLRDCLTGTLRTPCGGPPPTADLLGLAASVTVCDCDLWVTHSGYISVQVIYIMHRKRTRETERAQRVLFNRQWSLLNGKEGIYFFAGDGRCSVLCTAQVAYSGTLYLLIVNHVCVCVCHRCVKTSTIAKHPLSSAMWVCSICIAEVNEA